jgi:NifB/MoaA-like Fe-S oxidoreductase
MTIRSVDGQPLRDCIDWQWLGSEEVVELEVAELGHVCLRREAGQPWGIEFAEPVFDGVRRCVNDCCFCFMKMLPSGMRPSLYLRDDDYRLSFLQGNFVTLTNVSDADLERIIGYRLSPLHVSLHAVNPKLRERLMGKNHARGLEVLETLLAAGIKVQAQVVLVPGINDGAALDETLSWTAQRPRITAVGIVPYGYTRYAALQRDFTPQQCRELCERLATQAPRVQLADEFYLRAFADNPLPQIPPASYYGDFPLLEDGIGLVRRALDDPAFLHPTLGAADAPHTALAAADARHPSLNAPGAFHSAPGVPCVLVTGEAFAPVLQKLVEEAAPPALAALVVIQNRFFGGNVNVAGLLTAADVIEQLREQDDLSEQMATKGCRVILPNSMFNDDGLTLDDKTATDIAAALGCEVVGDASPFYVLTSKPCSGVNPAFC